MRRSFVALLIIMATSTPALCQSSFFPTERLGPRATERQGRENLRPTQRLERIALAREAANAALATLPKNAAVDAQLLANARERIGARLEALRRAGSLSGNRPEHGWTVACDTSTTSNAMRRTGRLGCVAGIALSKPAEFHFLRLERGGFKR
ncbi:MAG: hypothetical protein ING31_07960 [Burkholderiales bacterium]|nr:hypothetical protein [Burkholderiales bacterium]